VGNKLGNNLFFDFGDDDNDFVPLLSDGNEEELSAVEMPETLPILALRNTVLFPGVVIPITVGRDKSIRLVKEAYKNNTSIGVVAQKDTTIEDPEVNDLNRVGTMASIVKILNMPDDTTSVIIHGKRRFHLDEITGKEPYLKGRVTPLSDIKPSEEPQEFEAIIGTIKDLALKIVQYSSNVPQEASFAIKNIEGAGFLVNYLCSNSDLGMTEKQELLEIDNIRDRAVRLLEHLSLEFQKQKLKKDIQSKVKLEIDQQQREYLLNQQMKTIQDELGGSPF
jgi:ATP-dependent Lon protease